MEYMHSQVVEAGKTLVQIWHGSSRSEQMLPGTEGTSFWTAGGSHAVPVGKHSCIPNTH